MYSQDDLYGDSYSAPARAPPSGPSGGGPPPLSGDGGGPPSAPSGPRPERRAVRNAAAFASDYDEGKMFIGGLNWDTTDESLQEYFQQFGAVSSCVIMREGGTGKSRGFAFLTFEEPASVNEVMSREHFLDGKIIDPKRAIPRPDQARTQKCFVGGVPQTATQESFRRLFERYGQVLNSTVMMDNETGRPRGFAFVTYSDDASVDRCLADAPLNYQGSMLDIKRATTKDQMFEERGGGMHGRGRGRGRGGWGGPPGRGGGWGARSSGGYDGHDDYNTPPIPPAMPPVAAPFDPATMAHLFASLGFGTPRWNPTAAWAHIQGMLPSWGGPPPVAPVGVPPVSAPPMAWGPPTPAQGWGADRYGRERERSPPRADPYYGRSDRY